MFIQGEKPQQARDFTVMSKIQQQHRASLVISDTIWKLLNVLVVRAETLYKVFIPAKANMFLLGGKAYTMKYQSHTQYCTSILGHHRGVQPFPTA